MPKLQQRIRDMSVVWMLVSIVVVGLIAALLSQLQSARAASQPPPLVEQDDSDWEFHGVFPRGYTGLVLMRHAPSRTCLVHLDARGYGQPDVLQLSWEACQWTSAARAEAEGGSR